MDRDLRELERRWRTSSLPNDARELVAALRRVAESEVDLLGRCLDAGVTTPRRVEMASMLGHAPAQTLLIQRDRVLLDAAQLASIFVRSPGAIRDWCNRGCPHHSWGRHTRFDITAVLGWCEGTNRDASYRRIVPGALVRACAFWEPATGAWAPLAILRQDQALAMAHGALNRLWTPQNMALLGALEEWARSPGHETLAGVSRAAGGVPARSAAYAQPGHRDYEWLKAAGEAVAATGQVEAIVQAACATEGHCHGDGQEPAERFRRALRERLIPWALFQEPLESPPESGLPVQDPAAMRPGP